MNPIEIIDKFYPQETEQRHILLIHSLSVAQKALKIVDAHPNLPINRSFVREAALLHDIGIFLTDAPTIQCFGEHPYIAHGYLGDRSFYGKKVLNAMRWLRTSHRSRTDTGRNHRTPASDSPS